MTTATATRPVTPVGTVNWPHLFRKDVTKNDDGTEKSRYEITLIFSPEAQQKASYKAMEKAIQTAAEEKWGRIPKGAKLPLKKCEDAKTYCEDDEHGNKGEGPVQERFKGCTFAVFSSQNKVGVFDNAGGYIEEESEIYRGCVGAAMYHTYCYDIKGKALGVNFGIDAFRKFAEGTPLGGGGGKAVDADEAAAAFAGVDFDADPDDDEII
jgi:hypothetical protein